MPGASRPCSTSAAATAGVRRLRRLRHRRRTSTPCSPRHPGVERLPGAHCYEVFAGADAVRRAARRGAGDVLPHRLPRPALRRPRVAGPRPRPSPGAARHLLRQLPAGGAAVAVRRRRRRRRRPARRGRAARARVRAPPRRARRARRAVPVDGRGVPPDAAAAAARSSSSCGATSRRRSTGRSAATATRCCCRTKFQRAIDRAKRKAKIHTAQEDVAQWRRESRPLDGDVAAAAQAEADRLEADYRRAPRQAGLRRRLGARRESCGRFGAIRGA